jgi:hypothetical protein
MAVPQLFLVRNSAIDLVVRNIAELRSCGLKLRMPTFVNFTPTIGSWVSFTAAQVCQYDREQLLDSKTCS